MAATARRLAAIKAMQLWLLLSQQQQQVSTADNTSTNSLVARKRDLQLSNLTIEGGGLKSGDGRDLLLWVI
jgi:hypothetical protein